MTIAEELTELIKTSPKFNSHFQGIVCVYHYAKISNPFNHLSVKIFATITTIEYKYSPTSSLQLGSKALFSYYLSCFRGMYILNDQYTHQ